MTMRWKRAFGYANIQSIPETAVGGVYGFWHVPSGLCLYVGYTERPLKVRLMEYWRGTASHNPNLLTWLAGGANLVEICYLEVKGDKMRIKRMEERLIRAWSPKTNVIHN